jgi:surface antigen
VRIFQVAPAATSPPSAGAGGAAQNLTYGALGYPWVGAETINESTYDWGYRTCRSDIGAANCAALTITRKGVHYFESDPWRYYIRNCTSYVAWRLHSLGVPTKLLTGLGDAAGWATSAAAKGVSSGTTPKPGAVAIDPSAAPPHGHVAFIEAVNKDGTITVSEYNFFKRGSGDRWTGKPAAHGFTRYVYFGPYEGEPSGSFDSLEAATPGTARAAGWAADPDTPTSPINVRFDVDGKANSTALANQRRADIGKAYAAYGPNHGFAATLTLAAGRHNVCVYALNVGFSSNQKLGCKTITVTAPPPPPQVQVINVAVCPHSDTTQIGNDPYTGAPGYRCNRDYSGSSFPAPPAVECSATILNGSGKQFTIELLRGDGSVLEAAPTEVAAASPWAADVYRTVDPGFTIPPGSYRCVVQVGGVTFADVAFTLG